MMKHKNYKLSLKKEKLFLGKCKKCGQVTDISPNGILGNTCRTDICCDEKIPLYKVVTV